MPTFHHWRAGKQRNGLTFQAAADARAFDKGVLRAYNELIDGMAKSNPSVICPPLTKYDSVGEDDVFMVNISLSKIDKLFYCIFLSKFRLWTCPVKPWKANQNVIPVQRVVKIVAVCLHVPMIMKNLFTKFSAFTLQLVL